jgi:hypothetical protein
MFYKANRHQAAALAALAREIGPDEVQVNTPLRPCAVRPLRPAEMAEILSEFSGLPVVSVYEAERPVVRPLDPAQTLQRRPEL